MAIDPDGSATAVWVDAKDETELRVQAATRPPGGAFGAVKNVSTAFPYPGVVTFPRIAIGPDGTAVIVWVQNVEGDSLILTSTRPPGGSFGTPVTAAENVTITEEPRIAVGEGGTTTLVWPREDPGGKIIQFTTRTAGGTFSEPADLSTEGTDSVEPKVAIGPDSTTVVVWSSSASTGPPRVEAAIRAPGGAFSDPDQLSVVGEYAAKPQVDFSPDGTATAVWAGTDTINGFIATASRAAGGTFGDPTRLSTPAPFEPFGPHIATGSDGTQAVVWLIDYGAEDIAFASVRPPAGAFGIQEPISVANSSSFSPEVSVGDDGAATAIWTQSTAPEGTPVFEVVSKTRPPGGAFGSLAKLSPVTGPQLSAQVGVGPLNEAVAVWDDPTKPTVGIRSSSTQLPKLALTVSRNGSGTGTITSSPAGIDCGSACSGSFTAYSKVTLTATPSGGGTFTSWGGTCAGATGNNCEVTMAENRAVTATFTAGSPALKIVKFGPKKPKVKRNKVVKIKVTVKNTGKSSANAVKLCAKPTKKVKKSVKPASKACQPLGTIAAGKSKTKNFRLKATKKAKSGRKYKVPFTLTAKGVKTAKGAVMVKVKR